MANVSIFSPVRLIICLSLIVHAVPIISNTNDDSTSDNNEHALAPILLLIDAVLRSDDKQVESLLKSNTNVNESNSRGMTPLLAASITGNQHMAEVLLNHKAQADHKDKFGTSPILVAQKFLNTPLSRLLKKALEKENASSIKSKL